jgi:hypothetical protein
MRLVIGIGLVVRGIIELQSAPPISLAVIHVLATGAGILLLAGLWTPIAGALVAILALWHAFSLEIRGAISCWEPSVPPWPCSDRAPGPSMPAFLDGNASSLPTERVRSPTSLVLVLTHFKRVFLPVLYGVHGDSIWGLSADESASRIRAVKQRGLTRVQRFR